MHPKALLDHAAELTLRALRFEHPADAVVSRYFREQRALGPRERATLAETTYAVLRRKPLYEHLARSGQGGRQRRLASLGFQAPRDFLKQALTEPEKAWVDACDAAMRAPDLPEPLRHNLPAWVVAPLREQLPEHEFEALAAALLESAPLDLRVNTLLQKREQVAESLRRQGVNSVPTPLSPWGLRLAGKPALQKLELFTQGAFEVQDEGSQLLALLVDARRGEMVADFCAGAGGKTLALGASMRNTGRLYAFDVSAKRLDALKPRLARSGLSNVHPVAIAHERDDRVRRLRGKMDRVLIDAPCSGLGTLRRNPDLKWRQSPEAVTELVAKQQAILDSAARLLKPGGRLVYATCSLLQAENEAVAEAFDAAQSDFAPLAVSELLGELKLAEPAALCTPDGRFLRLWPHRHGSDGFFAAVWQRRG